MNDHLQRTKISVSSLLIMRNASNFGLRSVPLRMASRLDLWRSSKGRLGFLFSSDR